MPTTATHFLVPAIEWPGPDPAPRGLRAGLDGVAGSPRPCSSVAGGSRSPRRDCCRPASGFRNADGPDRSDFETSLITTAGDQYASMPSLHVAWASGLFWPCPRWTASGRSASWSPPTRRTRLVMTLRQPVLADAVARALLACATWVAVTRIGSWLTVRAATGGLRRTSGLILPADGQPADGGRESQSQWRGTSKATTLPRQDHHPRRRGRGRAGRPAGAGLPGTATARSTPATPKRESPGLPAARQWSKDRHTWHTRMPPGNVPRRDKGHEEGSGASLLARPRTRLRQVGRSARIVRGSACLQMARSAGPPCARVSWRRGDAMAIDASGVLGSRQLAG